MQESIAQIHTKCISAFLSLISALSSSHRWNDHNAAQDAFDKYKLWAGNVGAMHTGTRYKSSLDYRLREASFYTDQVLRLMHNLRSCLDKASKTARIEDMAPRDRITQESEPSDTDEGKSDSSDSPWEVSSDSEAEYPSKGKLPRQNLDRTVTETVKLTLVDPINFIIDCLWRLPIRSPAPIDRMKKKYIADTTAYLPFDIMHVREKFPELNETVTTRLAKMISRRRQLMRYRKDHTDALQEKETATIDTTMHGHGHLPRPTEGDIASESALSSKGPSQRTELTKATTLKLSAPITSHSPAIGLYTPSVSSFASSTVSDQTANAITIKPPNRPRTKEGRLSERFICPYCSTAQVITSERRWTKHVLSDLQPYICTYSDCQLHEYLFENLDDWFRHESRTHRMEWFCNTESHQSFVEREEFLDHMHKVHFEPLEEKQLQSLHHGLQRPSNASSGTCTLCGQHAHILKSHLARHLEQLALFAIPQTDYMATLEDSDTSSNAARQGLPARSSLGSTRIASNPSGHESDSELSDASLGNIGHRMRSSRAATDDQYIEENEQTALVSSEDGLEGVDTSWDQITSKFKDARVTQPSTDFIRGGFDVFSETPGEVLRGPDLDNHVPRASTTPTDRYKLFFEGDAERPSIVRSISGVSAPLSQQPGMTSDSNATQGANAKERRTLRQRFSKAIGIGNKPHEIDPAVAYLYGSSSESRPSREGKRRRIGLATSRPPNNSRNGSPDGETFFELEGSPAELE